MYLYVLPSAAILMFITLCLSRLDVGYGKYTVRRRHRAILSHRVAHSSTAELELHTFRLRHSILNVCNYSSEISLIFLVHSMFYLCSRRPERHMNKLNKTTRQLDETAGHSTVSQMLS